MNKIENILAALTCTLLFMTGLSFFSLAETGSTLNLDDIIVQSIAVIVFLVFFACKEGIDYLFRRKYGTKST